MLRGIFNAQQAPSLCNGQTDAGYVNSWWFRMCVPPPFRVQSVLQSESLQITLQLLARALLYTDYALLSGYTGDRSDLVAILVCSTAVFQCGNTVVHSCTCAVVWKIACARTGRMHLRH